MFDLIAIDIGNTNTTIAYYKNGEIKRLDNKKTKYVSSKLKLLLAEKIVISSVVPVTTAVILKKYPLAEILTLQNISDINFPENIGIDRAINVVTAMKL
ncbi:MAG: type III pantothenate kinase, partial [Candidatus Riflemargulisbacteria bacterium]